jgi:hypothetical protein
MVVPQFWQAITTVVFRLWRCNSVTSTGDGGPSSPASSPLPWPGTGDFCALAEPQGFLPWTLILALFDTLLLYAGHPLQPSAPPVPLQRPPPGQLPEGVWSSVTYVAPGTLGSKGALFLVNDFFGIRSRLLTWGRIRLVGRGAFLDFW